MYFNIAINDGKINARQAAFTNDCIVNTLTSEDNEYISKYIDPRSIENGQFQEIINQFFEQVEDLPRGGINRIAVITMLPNKRAMDALGDNVELPKPLLINMDSRDKDVAEIDRMMKLISMAGQDKALMLVGMLIGNRRTGDEIEITCDTYTHLKSRELEAIIFS